MTDVSRGTPGAPEVASSVFGERLPLAESYAEWLAISGVERGLIGPRETPRLWDRHVLNCAVVAELVPQDLSVADVGSGAGLPGVVLAIARPDLRVTLIEPLLRRVTFLEEVTSGLGLGNVEVVRARAEDCTGVDFDVVTSRAVAPLPRLMGWCLPLTRVGGAVVAMKGSQAAAEIADVDPAAWSRSGARTPTVRLVGAGVVDPRVTVVRVVRERVARVRLGERGGRPAPGGRGPRPQRPSRP